MKKDLQVLEDRFISEKYTPDFLVVDAESLCKEDLPLLKKK